MDKTTNSEVLNQMYGVSSSNLLAVALLLPKTIVPWIGLKASGSLVRCLL